MGELNKQVSALTEEKRQFEAKVATLEQENAAHQTQPDSSVTASQTEEIQKLNVSHLVITHFGCLNLFFQGFFTGRARPITSGERKLEQGERGDGGGHRHTKLGS